MVANLIPRSFLSELSGFLAFIAGGEQTPSSCRTSITAGAVGDAASLALTEVSLL